MTAYPGLFLMTIMTIITICEAMDKILLKLIIYIYIQSLYKIFLQRSYIKNPEENMAVILEAEIQSDLEALYKITGDLLNEIELHKYENCPLIDLVKFRLEDIGGTLQKDIFNLRHLSMKTKTGTPYA